MRSTVHERAHRAVWDVVRPARPSRVPGVSMAGFLDRGRAPAGHRVIPHPAVTVALEFGDGPLVVDDAEGGHRHGSLVVGLGLGPRPGVVRVRGDGFAAIQVRLSPLVVRAALGVAPSELGGALVGLDDLWGRESSRIREQLGEASSWDGRFALTEAVFARPRDARAFVHPEVAWAWSRIVARRGMVRVERLATEVGWSRKRLWSRFRAQVGLTPKQAARLVRFDHAAHLLSAGETAARAAAEGGYADQSHLHRDVAAFTGVTPGALAREPFLAVDDVAWADHGPVVSVPAVRAAAG
jgi:AraC-like DNA-binding protein